MRLTETELARWGESIGASASPPMIVGLVGPLGAGKSVLARAVGVGAGVTESMPSPSYNLLFRYQTPSGTEVVHLDLYRLTSPDEVWELGWGQLGADAEVVLVEWPERAEDLMFPDHWRIELTPAMGHPELRDVSVARVGNPPAIPGFPMSVSAE